jgi:hypothetical protein
MITTTSTLPVATIEVVAPRSTRPPGWLIAATAALAISSLVMAVAETTLWKHYLIDQGEYVSLAGLVFIAGAGGLLYRNGQLTASLPLTLPWLLLPVITQGDQLIDNLTINQMRLICHLLLAALFGTPVAVVVVAARTWAGLSRRAGALLAAVLLAAEIWIADRFLGTLMIATLGVMIAGTLWHAARAGDRNRRVPRRPHGKEHKALALLALGIAASFGLYIGFKHRPGAYQGSPAYYMDPLQADAMYALDRIAVPPGGAETPEPGTAEDVRLALTGYGRALEELLEGYYIADRNYNYAFHNALFLRNTPLLPNYREVALGKAATAARIAAEADAHAAAARSRLADDNPLAALIDEAREYTAFNLRRSIMLERMSGAFERTPAGLQHATHLYEGEGKVLGARLSEALAKHRATLENPALAGLTAAFARSSAAVHDRYANRIVGF